MPMFDLGTHLDISRQIPVGPERAYRIACSLVERYANQGLDLRLDETNAPAQLIARFRHPKGTALAATVHLDPIAPGQTQLRMHLQGKVFVGGMQGMLASDGLVRKIAREKLEENLDRVLDGIEPEEPEPQPQPEPEPRVEAPEPAPSPEPAPADPAPTPAAVKAPNRADYDPNSLEGKLALVGELHAKGLITDEEFRRKKQALLDRL